MTPQEIEQYFDRLWPICRSITGDGLRRSLSILQELIPLELTEVATGTTVFDWTIPKEWNIRDAYILTPDGRRIAHFKNNNLHVVNYSCPVHEKLNYEALKEKIHTLPSQPKAIPYITTYYKENWGFCMSHEEWLSLPQEGEYTAIIDSDLKDGSLTYGQAFLKGESEKEIFFSTYLCHPSMANNELSGPLALAFLYQQLSQLPSRKYSYRFLIAPETIGVIAFLAEHGNKLKEVIMAGYVLTCCGDPGPFHYKQSKKATSLADRAAMHVLKYSGMSYQTIPFAVGGSDERQYCSPGFNMPVGSLMRTPYQKFKEYHTSLDNKNFIDFSSLQETVEMYRAICEAIEMNEVYVNQLPFCEPQMGKRGLYPSSINPDFQRQSVHLLMHFLTYADGEHDLLQIAELKDSSIFDLKEPVGNCLASDLVKPLA